MIRKAILFLLSLGLSLGVAEGLLSLGPTSMRHWFPKGMYQNDSDPGIAYRLSPNVRARVRTPHFRFAVTANGQGFRGAELAPGSTLFIRDDQHLDQRGNALVAEQLVAALRTRFH